MKFNKLINKISILSLMFFTLSSCSIVKKTDDAIRNEIVATYSLKKITRGEVEDYFKGFVPALVEKYGQDYKNNNEYINKQLRAFTENYAQNLILIEEFDKRGIATDDEIDKEIDEMVNNIKESFIDNENGTLDIGDGRKIDEEKLNAELKASFYVDIEDYKVKQRDIQKINKLVEDLIKDVSVTEDEIRKEYEDNKDKKYVTGPGAIMSHILVNTEEEALKVKERISSGEKYEDLAAELNKDSTSKTGGSLGFVEYDSKNFDQDFLNGAKNLKEGEISDPVKSSFGYHIIKVEGIRSEPKYDDFESVKTSIEQILLNEKRRKEVSDFSEKLYKDNKLKIK